MKRKNIEDIKDEVEANIDYKLISSVYKNNKTPVEILHTVCGNIFDMRPDCFHNGQRCPNCRRNRPISEDEFLIRIENVFGTEEYSVLTDFVNTDTRVKILHNRCGFTRSVLPHRLMNGDGCKYCRKKSNGESRIEECLNKLEIEFEREFLIPELYSKSSSHPLLFDFCVHLNEKNSLIEYDGIHHFKPVKFFGGKNAFEELRIRDKLKTDYCLKNGIDFLRISYTDYKNIENILEKFLVKGSTTIRKE